MVQIRPYYSPNQATIELGLQSESRDDDLSTLNYSSEYETDTTYTLSFGATSYTYDSEEEYDTYKRSFAGEDRVQAPPSSSVMTVTSMAKTNEEKTETVDTKNENKQAAAKTPLPKTYDESETAREPRNKHKKVVVDNYGDLKIAIFTFVMTICCCTLFCVFIIGIPVTISIRANGMNAVEVR